MFLVQILPKKQETGDGSGDVDDSIDSCETQKLVDQRRESLFVILNN